MINNYPVQLGCRWLGDNQAHFLVWAPLVTELSVHLLRDGRYIPLNKDEKGYFSGVVNDVQVGDLYFYSLDGVDRPDPASRYQPQGVHGPSQIIDYNFAWSDDGFAPPSMRNSVFYELHVGTMTKEGTFLSLIAELPRLKALGVTSIEIMPVNQCAGKRNWGYDGVSLYAPMNAYGTPEDLKTLVNAAHQHGLAVFLDVVYNHLGPEGNYLSNYGHYFSAQRNAWGESLNFAGRHSDEVRRFFIENAIYWLDEFHIDGLRLDATHAMVDSSARPFLQVFTHQVKEWAEYANRTIQLIAENDQNYNKLVLPPEAGGMGLHGQWIDEFSHSVHSTVSGEGYGYHAPFQDFAKLPKVLHDRYAFTGEYSPLAGRIHGTYAGDIPADRFVAFVQTHDHVGNRPLGDRLNQHSGIEAAKVAAGYLLTSPYPPMLFMGQEYAEKAPFYFFVDFSDKQLQDAVREGRKREFAYFGDLGEYADPNDETTFLKSKLNPELRHEGDHALLYRLYETLLKMRRQTLALRNPEPRATQTVVDVDKRIMCIDRLHYKGSVRVLINWNLQDAQSLSLPSNPNCWEKVIDSQSAEWRNDGQDNTTAPDVLNIGQNVVTLPALSFAIYVEA